MQPIEYRGFRIEATQDEEFGNKFRWTIMYPPNDYRIDLIFDASPAVYDTEKNCLEDAKYVIDKYHDTK